MALAATVIATAWLLLRGKTTRPLRSGRTEVAEGRLGPAGGGGGGSGGLRPVDTTGAAHRRAVWSKLFAAIGDARAARLAHSPPAGSHRAPAAVDAPGSLDPQYVREGIRALRGMLHDCYESALAREPNLAGRVTVQFVLSGEPSVGGIVEDSEVLPGEGALSQDRDFTACVRETMYALDLPAAAGSPSAIRSSSRAAPRARTRHRRADPRWP